MIVFQKSNGDMDNWMIGLPWQHLLDGKDIVLFTADGKELDLILKNTHNLLHTDHWLQVWYGDTAKFLFRNFFNIPGMMTGSTLSHEEAMLQSANAPKTLDEFRKRAKV